MCHPLTKRVKRCSNLLKNKSIHVRLKSRQKPHKKLSPSIKKNAIKKRVKF